MIINNPEFSHIIKLDEIGAGASQHKIAANATEREALIERFDLAALDQLEASLSLVRSGTSVRVSGSMAASVVQNCIAGGGDVAATLDEPIEINFTLEPESDTNVEIELAEKDCDTLFFDGKIIDIGELVAQSLGLALNPYPRSATAAEKLKAAGVKAEDEVTPLGALSGLKDLLAKK